MNDEIAKIMKRDQIQNREVNNLSSVIIIQKAKIKSSVGQHIPPTNAKTGSGAIQELKKKSTALWIC
jgi:hypothetical protein